MNRQPVYCWSAAIHSSRICPSSTRPEIQVKRPEIYFGEITDWPALRQNTPEVINYAEGDANNHTSYEGTGGIRMGSLLRRISAISAKRHCEGSPLCDIIADSVLLLRRNIVERVSTIAPFLTLDSDPYLVVGDDGALYWFIDAFTTSANYPFSRALRVGNDRLNYIRNSVKAVVDAYNGTVTFYVFDPSDPLINAYQSMFPALFRPASAMPEGLRKHVRFRNCSLGSRRGCTRRITLRTSRSFTTERISGHWLSRAEGKAPSRHLTRSSLSTSSCPFPVSRNWSLSLSCRSPQPTVTISSAGSEPEAMATLTASCAAIIFKGMQICRQSFAGSKRIDPNLNCRRS
jgi:hypothetical protein